jgi:uncharacterized secreted protein with C-terminal beta-propeller domain
MEFLMSKPFLLTSLLLSLVACRSDKTNDTDLLVENPDPILLPFQNCGETQDYLAEIVLNQALSYRYSYYGGWDMAAEDSEAGADNSGGGESAPTDYTTTNNQEEGVDEIDLVKTDGQYIYIAQDRALHIVDSWPVEDAEKVASVDLEGWAQGLFLHGDQVVVAQQVYDNDFYGTQYTFFDVSDRENPFEVRTIDIEGYQADARMIGQDMYFVLNHWLSLPSEAWDIMWDDSLGLPEVDWNLSGEELEADLEAKREQARQILEPVIETMVANWNVDEMLPQWRDSAGSGQFEPMYDCQDLYRPSNVSQYNMLSLFHVDIEEDTTDATGLMSNGWTVYASQDNLYVAQTSRWWWWGWGDINLDTHIHKFELNPDAEPEYTSSGSVAGWIYDQFAMSEYDGHLRVASTELDWWWGSNLDDEDIGNNVTVLQDVGNGLLREVGSVTGIAPGEQIMACRMMGEKGYVVTFEQTDPLFTIDLANPLAPEVIGELHIPGFSTYLHPMDGDHLLAIGMAGLDDGTLTGMAVNIFDVTDFANPLLEHQYEITNPDAGWSWSEALWEHHAFTYHRDVLTIPAYRYDYTENSDGSYDYDYFSGAISFAIDDVDGISMIGEVDHYPLVEDSQCLYSLNYDYYEENVCDDWAWYANVRRNVYIEDNLFSISNYGVRITDLNDPTISIKDVLFYPDL